MNRRASREFAPPRVTGRRLKKSDKREVSKSSHERLTTPRVFSGRESRPAPRARHRTGPLIGSRKTRSRKPNHRFPCRIVSPTLELNSANVLMASGIALNEHGSGSDKSLLERSVSEVEHTRASVALAAPAHGALGFAPGATFQSATLDVAKTAFHGEVDGLLESIVDLGRIPRVRHPRLLSCHPSGVP